MMSYGNTYSVAFSSADSSAVVKDVFEITASTKANLRIHEVHLGKIAAAMTSTAIENLAVLIRRGSSAAAAGGSTNKPINIDARSQATAEFTVLNNSSTPGSSTGDILFSAIWNTQKPFVWKPAPEDRPTCILSQRLQVRLGAPAAAIVINGSIIVEEIPKAPGVSDR